MDAKTLTTLVVWAAIFALTWWSVKKQPKGTNEPYGLPAARPKRDRMKLMGIAIGVASMAFLFFTFGVGFISDHTPYVNGVNIFGVVVAVLGLYALFVIGMFLTRRSKGQPVSRVFRDAALLLLQSAVVIAVLFVWLEMRQQH